MYYRPTTFIPLFLLLFGVAGQAQSPSKKSHPKNRRDTTFIVIDTCSVYFVQESFIEAMVDQLADSLNRVKGTGVFPAFLEDAQLDYSLPITQIAHQTLPLRYMILKRVKDCQSLKMIIDSDNPKYRRLPVKEDDVKMGYLEYSFHDLAVKRYKELYCSAMYP